MKAAKLIEYHSVMSTGVDFMNERENLVGQPLRASVVTTIFVWL